MKIIGMSGSLRQGSYNSAALRAAQALTPDGATLEIAEIGDLPLYNDDVRAEGYPASVDRLRRQLGDADALLLVTPEYNFSVSGVLKNAIDWASRPPNQPFDGKPVGIMGASSGLLGTARAQYHLRQMMVFLNAYPVNKPEVMIGQAQAKFDEGGNLSDDATKEFIRKLLASLVDWAEHDGRADLYTTFAAPMAAASLAELLGFYDVSWETMQDWSQALIDGAGNYSGDVDVDRRAYEASAGVDAAIDAVLEDHIASPNPSMLSSMINATSPMPIEEIRANVKVVIGGGLNEPRDAILTLALALLENPSQRDAVLANPELWPAALEEAIRWISPIGMYPRRVARDTELSGIRLPEGLQIGLCVGAANRDSRRFADPDRFDICRPKQSHLGFGAGTHFCAGAWVARHTVGRLAVPKLFARLRNLRLADDGRPAIRGWVFRGPVSLPVRWN